ncbi:MAG: protein kinase [Fuerstiella sp.]|nr:protein kinase [Fuerstiella sp.]
MTEGQLTEGQPTVGSFTLHNCISTGNSTQIWEVSEQGIGARLAMKLLLEESHKLSEEKAVLKHEFKVGKSLTHPGFLTFHQIEVNRDHGFFTMDFASFPSLKQHITSSLPRVQSNFSKLAVSLCESFHFMHEHGWLHRDIKPDNILVTNIGEVKVIDFSLSTRVKGGLGKLFSRKQAIQGTRNYIAPETLLKKPADQRTDQYSLGVTLFEVLTGSLPFAGTTPMELLAKHVGEAPAPPSTINPNVTLEAEKLVLKMLAKKPGDRFETMREASSAFHEVKCFQEDPWELYERMTRDEKEKQTMSVDKRLDSRADAERTAKGIRAPVSRKKTKKTTGSVLAEDKQKQKANQAAVSQIPPMVPPMPYPGGMPGYQMPGSVPGQPYPGQFVPGQQVPSQGQPMPVQSYPGQAYPGPPVPGQAYPGPPVPGQAYPGPPVPGYPEQPYPGQIYPGQPATGPIQQPDGIAQQDVPGVAGRETSVSSAATPKPSPESAQNPADPNTPQEATEDDVRGLMDTIE